MMEIPSNKILKRRVRDAGSKKLVLLPDRFSDSVIASLRRMRT